MLAVPPAILDLLQLNAGTAVGLSVDDGHLVIKPHPKPRYSLDELLSQCDPTAPMSTEDNDWLSGKPMGNELL